MAIPVNNMDRIYSKPLTAFSGNTLQVHLRNRNECLNLQSLHSIISNAADKNKLCSVSRRTGFRNQLPDINILTRQYRAESLLGNALSEALLQMAGTDFAMLNSGGLRADLKVGALTYGALYEVLPFDNNVATLTLTGAQIVEMFETLLSSHHGIPQIAGLRLTVEQCTDGAKVVSAKDSRGQALDPARLYRVALSDFLAMGGDGLGDFLAKVPDEHKDLGLKSERNLRDALAFLSEGRIQSDGNTHI